MPTFFAYDRRPLEIVKSRITENGLELICNYHNREEFGFFRTYEHAVAIEEIDADGGLIEILDKAREVYDGAPQ
jgi:hypothetical protein